ncbi:hypothetical protein [Mesorhizobium sp. M1A.F.Ca.ET.072.01.1.1]|uniref:hypothetical protein n=1 Tax=Mesorhizobium sp. M1A.F.Ca.ET.072.01.1.1 TaxID=2496753 RepID=UPI0016788537|nr:hypothetical protein [Mesorhizobium sp. M1A.F.Ca.ET.072.01.1.1]
MADVPLPASAMNINSPWRKSASAAANLWFSILGLRSFVVIVRSRRFDRQLFLKSFTQKFGFVDILGKQSCDFPVAIRAAASLNRTAWMP